MKSNHERADGLTQTVTYKGHSTYRQNYEQASNITHPKKLEEQLGNIQAYFKDTLVDTLRDLPFDELLRQARSFMDDVDRNRPFLDLDDSSTWQQWTERHAKHYLSETYGDPAFSDIGSSQQQSGSASRANSRFSSRSASRSRSRRNSPSPNSGAAETPHYAVGHTQRSHLLPPPLDHRQRSQTPPVVSSNNLNSAATRDDPTWTEASLGMTRRTRTPSIQSYGTYTLRDLEMDEEEGDSWIKHCCEHLANEFIYGSRVLSWAWGLFASEIDAITKDTEKDFLRLGRFAHAKTRWSRMCDFAIRWVMLRLLNDQALISHWLGPEPHNEEPVHRAKIEERFFRRRIMLPWHEQVEAHTFPSSRAPDWNPQTAKPELAHVYRIENHMGGKLRQIHDLFFEHLLLQTPDELWRCTRQDVPKKVHEMNWAAEIEQHVASELWHMLGASTDATIHHSAHPVDYLLEKENPSGSFEAKQDSWRQFLDNSFFTSADDSRFTLPWSDLEIASEKELEHAKKEIKSRRLGQYPLSEDFRLWTISWWKAAQRPRKETKSTRDELRYKTMIFRSWQTNNPKALEGCLQEARTMCASSLEEESREPPEAHLTRLPRCDGRTSQDHDIIAHTRHLLSRTQTRLFHAHGEQIVAEEAEAARRNKEDAIRKAYELHKHISRMRAAQLQARQIPESELQGSPAPLNSNSQRHSSAEATMPLSMVAPTHPPTAAPSHSSTTAASHHAAAAASAASHHSAATITHQSGGPRGRVNTDMPPHG